MARLIWEEYPGRVLPEKFCRAVWPASQNPYPIYDQIGGKMAKIDTQFMTKTAGGRTYLYGPYKGVFPPPLRAWITCWKPLWIQSFSNMMLHESKFFSLFCCRSSK